MCVTRYDREETELTLDSVRHLIKLHDTAGQEDYERLRKMIYKDVNGILNQLLSVDVVYALLHHKNERLLFSF